MICLDVYLNGERLCRAGRQDLPVLNGILGWVKLQEAEEEITLDVGGLYEHPSDGSAHPRWVHRLDLKRGDEVTMRFVDSESADDPENEQYSTPEWVEQQEREYYERVKAKFENE